MGTRIVVRIESDSPVWTLDALTDATRNFPGEAEVEISVPPDSSGSTLILRYSNE